MGVRQSVFAAAILAAAMGSVPAWGVVVSGTGSEATGNLAGLNSTAYNSVGIAGVNSGASCVYLGNGWVISAAHVGTPSQVTLMTSSGAQVFNVDGSTSHTLNNNGTANASAPADALLYRITDYTSDIYAANLLNPHTTSQRSALIYYVGLGGYRTSEEIDGTHYSVGGGWVLADKTSGTNLLERDGLNRIQLVWVSDDNGRVSLSLQSTFSDPDDSDATLYESMLASGDSGSAAFMVLNGVTYLVGINIGVNENTASAAPGYYGNLSFSTYLADALYYDQIVAITGVPEPASMALLGLGAVAVLSRRRR